MDLVEKIDELINTLSESDDLILILALREKKRCIKENYLINHNVSNKEKNNAIHGVAKHFKNNDAFLIKVAKIIDTNFVCDCCKHAKIEYYEGKNYKLPKENDRCDRCDLWCEKFKIYKKNREDNILEIAKKIPENVIELKALINKINNKYYEFIHNKK